MGLERIVYDGDSWDFSNYFEYIRSVEHQMPKSLREFAVDIDSYALHGEKTLHDARLLTVSLMKQYDNNFSNVSASIELRFIDQLFKGVTNLHYCEVSSYLLRGVDVSAHLHADVLVHEFSVVSPHLFRHRIILDHSGELEIEFGKFSYAWQEREAG